MSDICMLYIVRSLNNYDPTCGVFSTYFMCIIPCMHAFGLRVSERDEQNVC